MTSLFKKSYKNSRILLYYITRLIRMFRNTQRHVTSSHFYSINCRIVNSVTADGCIHTAESVGSRRELVANSCRLHTADADATQLDSFVATAVCFTIEFLGFRLSVVETGPQWPRTLFLLLFLCLLLGLLLSDFQYSKAFFHFTTDRH